MRKTGSSLIIFFIIGILILGSSNAIDIPNILGPIIIAFGSLILVILLIQKISKNSNTKTTSYKKTKDTKKQKNNKKLANQNVYDGSENSDVYKNAKEMLDNLRDQRGINIVTKIMYNGQEYILGEKPAFLNSIQKKAPLTPFERLCSDFYVVKLKSNANTTELDDLKKIDLYRDRFKNSEYNPTENEDYSFNDIITYYGEPFRIGDKPLFTTVQQKGKALTELEKKLIGIWITKNKRISEINKRIEEQRKREEKERLEKERLEREYQHGYRDDMTGYEYESYCADLFKYFGWNAEATKKSGDFGVDVIAEKNNIKIVAQCKHYTGTVGFDAVKEASTGKVMNNADYAIVITNSTYTKQAYEGASKVGVILLRHPELENWLKTL